MTQAASQTFVEFVRARREANRPVHVVVEYGPRSYPDSATTVAEQAAEVIAGEDGCVVRESADECGTADVILLDVNPNPRQAAADWQQYRELAAKTRRSQYGGVVAITPETDVGAQVYRAAEAVVRVGKAGINGIYRTRVDYAGGDVTLVEIESEVVGL
jgi:hypothetical protein